MIKLSMFFENFGGEDYVVRLTLGWVLDRLCLAQHGTPQRFLPLDLFRYVSLCAGA